MDVCESGLPQTAEIGTGADGICALQAEAPVDFVWGVGIEGSTIPHLNIDQFEWTQHNTMWKEDLRLVSELGLRHLRYSIPWSYLQPARGKFDWSAADERLGYCFELGLEPILDVMHFGTPTWLKQAVGDPEFPEALEELATEMVRRYRGNISTWCPVNEPLVMSLFSGDFGLWPPHSRKWRGYFPVLSRVAMGTSRAIRAIRREQPEARVMLCDAADHFQTDDESLRDEIRLRNLRRFLLLDLISGRVDEKHPLHEWIGAYGLSSLDLEWFRTNPQTPDVIGLDYYCHSDWQLTRTSHGVRQREAENPAGLYGVGCDYYNRYGLPLMVAETSIVGMPINRLIWLERMVSESRRLREDGIPLLGLIWWPLFDHMDWDGALTHRTGKLHHVGLYNLARQKDGSLKRVRTSVASAFSEFAARGTGAVGTLLQNAVLTPIEAEQDPPLELLDLPSFIGSAMPGVSTPVSEIQAEASAGPSPLDEEDTVTALAEISGLSENTGILVFSHLRWGFVWQRPQQFLSRFAMRHPILFVEEPIFDLPEREASRMDLHKVMTNVTVACPHFTPAAMNDKNLPEKLRELTQWAVGRTASNGSFDRPLLWYYNPADALWSLGSFPHCGIVYDCMDELSNFSGASGYLADAERWLMQYTDVVFAGGLHLGEKKAQHHQNVHTFGCGVEFDHFAQAMDSATSIPPDIDFIARPIFGWFGVVDERVDYSLLAEVARRRPDWSFAMVGPVVKVDPNLLPHLPNIFWLGERSYDVLPNYCKAFTVCMMCFAINDATQYINPTKALEYLASGRPVISTPVKDVVNQYAGMVDIVSGPDEFVAAGERLLAATDRSRIERGIEFARNASWEASVERMQSIIADAVASENRRSMAEPEPMMNIPIEYHFAATAGS